MPGEFVHVTDSNSSQNPVHDLLGEGILCISLDLLFGLVVHICKCSVFSRLICFFLQIILVSLAVSGSFGATSATSRQQENRWMIGDY